MDGVRVAVPPWALIDGDAVVAGVLGEEDDKYTGESSADAAKGLESKRARVDGVRTGDDVVDEVERVVADVVEDDDTVDTAATDVGKTPWVLVLSEAEMCIVSSNTLAAVLVGLEASDEDEAATADWPRPSSQRTLEL